MMTVDERIKSWKAEEIAPFEGWDFSYLQGRMIEDDPPWDYVARAQTLMTQADSLLDMDTGGGERLLEMQKHWPATVTATEGYAPNLKLARERLEPLGVNVVDLWMDHDLPVPFDDAEFDLIIIRHSGPNADELARIIKPGGTYFTQQVHGHYHHDLLAALNAPIPWPDATPEHMLPWLTSTGFEIIECQDWTGQTRFTDVGAIVYYLHAVPWMVRDFSVDTHLNYLLALQERLEREGSLVFESRMYMIEAKKQGV